MCDGVVVVVVLVIVAVPRAEVVMVAESGAAATGYMLVLVLVLERRHAIVKYLSVNAAAWWLVGSFAASGRVSWAPVARAMLSKRCCNVTTVD